MRWYTLSAEKNYSVSFTESSKKFYLNLHYNGANSYFFVNGVEIIKFKEKDSEINAIPLCLENISRDFSVDNMKKTWLNGYLYDFSVDYVAIAVDDVLNIHEYLMKQNEMMFRFIQKMVFTATTFFAAMDWNVFQRIIKNVK